MRGTARIAALGGAALLALIPAVGVGQAADDGGPWRLFRQYQNNPGPQEGFTFWVSAPDLAAADGPTPEARMLVLDLDTGGWSIARTEYLCGDGQARGLGLVRYDREGRPTGREPADAEPYVLIPHIPDGAVYSVVCNDAAPGEVEAADIAAAFARQAADRQRYLETLADRPSETTAATDAPAAETAGGAIAPAACSQARLLNPFFAVALPPHLAEGGPEAIIRTGGNGAAEELYGWRAPPGSTPGWSATANADMGLIRLAEGHAVTQGDLALPAGRWRLTLAAGGDGNGAARMVARLGDAQVGAAPLGGEIGMHAIDFELAANAEALSLAAEGGGAMVVMACLDRLGDLPAD